MKMLIQRFAVLTCADGVGGRTPRPSKTLRVPPEPLRLSIEV